MSYLNLKRWWPRDRHELEGRFWAFLSGYIQGYLAGRRSGSRKLNQFLDNLS